MKKATLKRDCWAILWRTKNNSDGESEHFLCCPDFPQRVRLFERRIDARCFIEGAYGYMKDRKDLRNEPHGWRMPRPVKVTIGVDYAHINRA